MKLEMYKKLVKMNVPLKVIIELTENCNLDCFFCILGKKKTKHEWSYQSLANVVERLREIGVLNIEISGGEPLLYKKLPYLLTLLRRKGFKVKIITNGVAIKPLLISLFKELDIELQISIHSLNPKTYKRITGKNFLERVLRNAEELNKNGVKMSVVSVVNRLNYKEINSMISYWKKLGVPFEFTPIIAPSASYLSSGKVGKIPYYQITREEMNELVKNLNAFEWEFEGPLNFPYPCEIGKTVLLIKPDGTVYPCQKLRIPLGNVYSSDILEIWRGNNFLSVIRQFKEDEASIKKLKNSVINTRVCIADNYNYGGNFTEVYPPVKEWDHVLGKAKNFNNEGE